MLEKNTNDLTKVLSYKADNKTSENNEAVELHSMEDFTTTKKQSKKSSKLKWILLSIFVFIILTASVAGAIGYYAYTVAMEIEVKSQTLKAKAQETYGLFKGQNLPAVAANIDQMEGELKDIEKTYKKLAFTKYVPVARTYYLDGEAGFNAANTGVMAAKKSINAITPYADVLGFTGEGTFTGGTAEDRLKVILETLDKVTPILDDISKDLQTIERELAKIDPNRYPEKVKDTEVRSLITQAQGFSNAAVLALTEYRPIIEQLPAIAGGKGERKKYLILFQNDNELRPTGGFLTAFAVVNVENGKVEAEKSDDIYEIDKKLTKKEPIPAELGRYLTTEKFLNLRDMNISPDFKVSMDKFFENYLKIKGEPTNIDGIIAVDTHFLTNLMKVLGPVEVPGYGTFTAENDARCDCPQIIYVLSEIITKPTPYLREDRKGILGPLMRALLTKAYTAPKQVWPALFGEGLNSVFNKHAQFYFMNEDAKTAVEKANIAGRMTAPDNTETDFLAIINANLGGAKSNLFVGYDVKQEVSEPKDGMIEKKVTITYKNSHKADNCNLEAGQLCLNSTLRDWTRLYVPKGSELVTAEGFLEEARTYEENGFTVIDGFFTLEPLGSTKLTFTYKVPYTGTKDYKVQLWKQGGIESFKTVMDVTGGQEEVDVNRDMVYQAEF